MDESLLWFNTKQSTLKKLVTFKYTDSDTRDEPTIHIPLEYVCFSSQKILTPKVKVLEFSHSSLSFTYFNNPDTKTISTEFQLNFSDITQLSYAGNNPLFSVSLQESFHREMIPQKRKSEKIFLHTIWFCLDIGTHTEYRRIISIITRRLHDKMALLPPHLFGSFVRVMGVAGLAARFTRGWENNQKNPTNSEEIEFPCRKSKRNRLEVLDITEMVSPPVKIAKTRRRESGGGGCGKSVYTPSPSHSIEIVPATDLLCLRPRTYVNDNIINCYIAYLFHEVLTAAQRSRTHCFNCFFNTKLIGTRAQWLTDTPQSRHARVAKWTKNVDIFDKDFLILPVIEMQHWFLVIVCFPWMAGMVDYGRLFGTATNGGDATADAADSAIPVNDSDFARRQRMERKQAMLHADPELEPMPCILIFDSLSFQKRGDKVNIIREYLKSEWDARRAHRDGPLIFDKTTARGYSPKVPQQKNHTDCGVYLLHYVESFFKCPIKKYTVEFFKEFLTRWFDQKDVDRKRLEIKDTILKVIHKYDDVELVTK